MRGPKARRLPLAYTHIVWLAPKELNFVYTLIRRALKTVEDRAKIYFGGREGVEPPALGSSIPRSTNWAISPYGTRCTSRTHYQLVWRQSSVLLRLRFIWYGAASECFPRFCCLEGSCARWSTNAAYWSGWWGTIPQPLRWQRNILPIELHPHMVGLVGVEPTNFSF